MPSFDAFTNFTGGTYEKEMHGAPGRGHAGALDSRLLSNFVKYFSVIGFLYYCLALFGIDTATLLASAKSRLPMRSP